MSSLKEIKILNPHHFNDDVSVILAIFSTRNLRLKLTDEKVTLCILSRQSRSQVEDARAQKVKSSKDFDIKCRTERDGGNGRTSIRMKRTSETSCSLFCNLLALTKSCFKFLIFFFIHPSILIYYQNIFKINFDAFHLHSST